MKLTNLFYLESVVDVALQFVVVPHQVDGVLVAHHGSVPQCEDHHDVAGLRGVQELAHVTDHGARVVQAGDVAIAVPLRGVVAFHVQPNPYAIFIV